MFSENLFPPDLDPPGGVWHEPAERAKDRARARPDLAGEASDDTALKRERDVVDAPRHVEPVDPDHRLARPGHRVLVVDQRPRPLHLAEHVLDQDAPVDGVDLVRCDALAVSQDRHAIAELEDLVQPVRDEDDAPALRDEVARGLEHALDLRLAERRGRLVENEEARVTDEEAGDLDELPLADRERLHRGPELDVAKAELVENAPCVLGEAAAPVDERHVEAPEKDVVLDAQLRHETQLLVHERDAVCLRVMWVPERDLLAVEADHAFVRPDEADESLHEGALAGAVVPADRVHLADPHVE